MKKSLFLKTLAIVVFLAPSLLLAHHPMGGDTPATFWQGLLSGFAHPVIGMDHLAMVLAVGFLALYFSRNVLLPAFFVGGTLGGAALHLAAISLPAVELMIGVSVLLAGLYLIWQKDVSPAVVMGLFAFLGLFHGHAYAEAIFGAEATPLVAYLLGFAAIQYAVAIAAMFAAAKIVELSSESDRVVLRVAGGMVFGVGFVFVAGQVLSAVGLGG